MAISYEILEATGTGRAPGDTKPQVFILPPKKCKRYAAVGLSDALSADTTIYRIRNIGDAVLARVNFGGDVTQAQTSDAQTFTIPAATVFDFMLPLYADPTQYKIDFRAAP